MRITTKTPEQFTKSDVDQLAYLAGIGFGQETVLKCEKTRKTTFTLPIWFSLRM